MPSAEALAAFIAHVESGRHVEAIEAWYHPDASMRENNNAPRQGRDALVRHETAVLARMREVVSECLSPPVCTGDHVVIHWRFRFVDQNGLQTTLEELAWQEWQGNRIFRERFFYDPAQLRRPG